MTERHANPLDQQLACRLRQRGFRQSRLSRWNQFGRLVWHIVYLLLFRPSPRPCHAWRRWLLRMFGARIGTGVRVYPSARIFAPWNIDLDDYSSIGDYVDCYSVGRITVGKYATVSQYSMLCTASHDYSSLSLPLTVDQITVGNYAWICADAFIMPGVSIGAGAVIGARAMVTRDVEPWQIVVGATARVIGQRVLQDDVLPDSPHATAPPT